MVDQMFNTTAVSPLASVQRDSGTAGITQTDTGVSLQILDGSALVQVFAAKGKNDAVASALQIGSSPGVATVNHEFTAMPISPGQWVLSATTGSDGSFCTSIEDTLQGIGYVSEQSQGRVIVRVTGVDASRVLQKGCRLDLHPSVVSPGFCAQTQMAQVGVLLHQVDDSPTYDLHVFSGFAQSFWHWLVESSAEFGCRIT